MCHFFFPILLQRTQKSRFSIEQKTDNFFYHAQVQADLNVLHTIICPSGINYDARSATASSSHDMIPRHSVLHYRKANFKEMYTFVRDSVNNLSQHVIKYPIILQSVNLKFLYRKNEIFNTKCTCSLFLGLYLFQAKNTPHVSLGMWHIKRTSPRQPLLQSDILQQYAALTMTASCQLCKPAQMCTPGLKLFEETHGA